MVGLVFTASPGWAIVQYSREDGFHEANPVWFWRVKMMLYFFFFFFFFLFFFPGQRSPSCFFDLHVHVLTQSPKPIHELTTWRPPLALMIRPMSWIYGSLLFFFFFFQAYLTKGAECYVTISFVLSTYSLICFVFGGRGIVLLFEQFIYYTSIDLENIDSTETPYQKEKKKKSESSIVTPDMFWTVCEGPMKNVRCVSPFQPNVCHPVVAPPGTLVLPALPLLHFFSFPSQKSPWQ